MAKIVKQLPTLPIERAIRTISGRWKAVILYHVLEAPKRLSELMKLMPTISQKVLVQQLRELEAHALVNRTVYAEMPPRVEYAATALGHSLQPIMLALCEWGKKHAASLDEQQSMDECIVQPTIGVLIPKRRTGSRPTK